jgi:hypothetical protein
LLEGNREGGRGGRSRATGRLVSGGLARLPGRGGTGYFT